MQLSIALCALLSAAATHAQTQYRIDQPSGNDNFGSRSTGQTITPNVGIVPNPGSPARLLLTQVTLYQGNSGASAPSATTYLNIYDGDPNNGGNFVGSSSNFIDTNSPSFRTPMVWTFGGLAVSYTTEFWAIMSSTNTAGGLNVAVSLETSPRNGPNAYTGGDGLIANIVRHPSSVDAKFEAVFEGGGFTVSGTDCPSSVGAATLSSTGVPTIGQAFQIDMSNASPAGTPFLIFGISDTIWGPFNLPVAINTLVPGTDPSCMLQVSFDVGVGMVLNGSTASVSIPIANQAALVGLPFFVQGLQLDSVGVSVTKKGAGVIGA